MKYSNIFICKEGDFMFGDKDIVGMYEKTLENKGRLHIPSSFGVIPEEYLGLAFGQDFRHILIMSLLDYEGIINKYKEINNKEILSQNPALVERISRLIGLVEVDKQRRIQIPKFALDKTGLEGEIVLKGQLTCAGVYKK